MTTRMILDVPCVPMGVLRILMPRLVKHRVVPLPMQYHKHPPIVNYVS